MSKARLVITAVTVEKRPVSEIARAYGVARSWVYTLLARYQAEGEAAFEPRSRRPKTSPAAISDEAADLIIRLRKELAGQGLDAGPQTITWHLEHHHQLKVSAATVSRYLSRAGLVTPSPAKRPKSSYIRFEADMPNERWQSDFTHYPLADGTDTEILTWLDDHSRYALSVTAHARVTGPIVLLAFRAACGAHGVPASTLTDNGMVFTTRLSGGKGGRNGLEHELRRLGIPRGRLLRRGGRGRPAFPVVRQGKVRYIGSSSYAASQIVDAQWTARDRHLERFATEQPPYSILVRGIEADVLPTARRHGMGILSYSPLSGGWLSGRWRKDVAGTPTSAARPRARFDMDSPANQRKLDVVEELAQLADKAGLTLIELAISFVINHPAVTSAIIGPRTMEQLESQLPAAEVTLTADMLDRIDQLVAPGTTINPDDNSYGEAELTPAALRRTP